MDPETVTICKMNELQNNVFLLPTIQRFPDRFNTKAAADHCVVTRRREAEGGVMVAALPLVVVLPGRNSDLRRNVKPRSMYCVENTELSHFHWLTRRNHIWTCHI
ncbi:hypothetical protein J6590_043319 [Homalodisca vitripennis]|nr:hypothetical protein J6590_043319 [Homalodisca vitripennis]